MLNRVGERYITTEGYIVTVIVYKHNSSTIEFEDGTRVYNCQFGQIKRGNIKNPNHKSIHGVGFIGVGPYTTSANGKLLKRYQTWNNMLKRCYTEGYQKRFPTYVGCSVDDEWHNYQNFASWYDQNYTEGFHLDKDLLFPGNKIYSPENCCFVPNTINTTFLLNKRQRGFYPIGVIKIGSRYIAQMNFGEGPHRSTFYTPEEAFNCYKKAKEQYIKNLAEIWKDLIDVRIYNKLINYTLNITD